MSKDSSATGTGRSARSNTGTGGGRSARRSAPKAGALCAFWLGDRHYGLDVSLVGEVVAVERALPVPMSPSSVRGIFNLRGNPIALLDMGAVLGLEHATSEARTTALVLKHEDLTVALGVDRMETVVQVERAALTAPGPNEHPAVKGFLALDDAKGRVVTVLDPDFLLDRVDEVRFIRGED